MKKNFDFGMIDFDGYGKRNKVTVEVEYKEKDDKKVFTACGNIWNNRHTDILAGGQCLDTIAEYIKDEKFLEIYRLWQLYHLNDMHPECEHQEALGWKEQASETIILYHYKLNDEASKNKKEAEKYALDCLRNGLHFTPTKEQTLFAGLKIFLDTYDNIEKTELVQFYVPYKSCLGTPEQETKLRGWVSFSESALGLLGKPCPVCGYKYGHGWQYRAIPEQDERSIYALLGD